ncbi:calcium-binding protein [Pseudaestuariivita rosea]|uniref:calcium-binding protein n=1 Tax=Pseudaestuariivita rosea TaxID=2763263 RepID=UPI001ABAB5D5
MGDDGADNTLITGLMRSAPLMRIFGEMMENGVDLSMLWSTQTNPSPGGLSPREGNGDHYTPTGYLFSMLSDALVGSRLLSDDIWLRDGTTQIGYNYNFQDGDNYTSYFVSGADGDIALDIDLSDYYAQDAYIYATVLGAAPGDSGTEFLSDASISHMTALGFAGLGAQDWNFDYTLGAYEMIQIRVIVGTGVDIEGDRFNAIADQLIGSNYGDTLAGHLGNDLLNGLGGDDILEGGAGNDTISGGWGHDVLADTAGADSLWGNTGNDSIYAGIGNDVLGGGDGNDLLFAGGGNDTVWGGTGDDAIYGLDGDDSMFGGDGADQLWGGNGNDTIFGQAGNDRLDGGVGHDSISAGGGDDHVFGGAGNDTLSGFDGNDVLHGGDGADGLWGENGNDSLYAGAGNDALGGGAGNDLMFGGSGQDILYDAGGSDTMYGGADEDSFIFTQAPQNDVIGDFELGLDSLTLRQDFWAGTLTASQVIEQFASVVGNDVVFDFGGDQVITLRGLGSTNGLADDLVLV